MKYFCGKCRSSCDERLVVCPSCGEWENYIPDVHMADQEAYPVEVLSARQLAARRAKLSTVWSLGQVPVRPPMLIAAWGQPGGGKSTWLAKLAAELVEVGQRVFIVNCEEGLGDTMSERLRRLEVRDEGILVAGNVSYPSAKQAAEEHDCGSLFLDSWSASSWSALSLDDAKASFFTVVVLHATKDGAAAGPNSILHVADVVVNVEAGKARLTKSRWSGAKETEVFQCQT